LNQAKLVFQIFMRVFLTDQNVDSASMPGAKATNDEVDGSPSTASKCQKGVRYDTDEGSHP
jgi:hypothetical protein